MNKLRLGIVGVGVMGSTHAKNVLTGKVRRCRLAAVCDTNPAQMVGYGEGIEKFDSIDKLIKSGVVDAVLIATPHYDHPVSAVKALKAGLHVLVEKPMSVQKSDCQKMIKAHKNKKQVFAIMFNQRTDPHYIGLKKMIVGGELGKIIRVNWIITNWFRTDAYYKSSSWRATWKGEGGGALVNQSPHQLDLLQWLCGMPVKVSAHCHLGKHHKISVEDEVTAYMEFKNGATGVFITSTGEAPGTNRLEITGDLGRVVVEPGSFLFQKNKMSASKYARTSKHMFGMPKNVLKKMKFKDHGKQHIGILENFVKAILDKKPLIAQAKEGIHSVEMANAMIYSSLIGKPVKLPISASAFDKALSELIKSERYSKK